MNCKKLRWKEMPNETGYGLPYIYFQFDDGEWDYPDCSVECQYCQCCLGCLRKLYDCPSFDEDFICPKSPDGEHHSTEKPGFAEYNKKIRERRIDGGLRADNAKNISRPSGTQP